MIPFDYRITLQLDRAREDAGFDDPVEVWTDEVRLALAAPSEWDAAPADERGGEMMVEIRAAIAAVLAKHGAAQRPSTGHVESSSHLPAIAGGYPAARRSRSSAKTGGPQDGRMRDERDRLDGEAVRDAGEVRDA